MPTVQLKPGHVQPVWAGHPWIYAQAIARVDAGVSPGDEVDVVDPRGNLLGRGFFSPRSSIPVRLMVRDATTKLDETFFQQRVARAIAWRASLGLPNADTTGYRLIYAEGDGIPGLIVDRFGDALAVQLLTFGMKRRSKWVLDALAEQLKPRAIVDRTPAAIAKTEEFEPGAGVVFGEDIEELAFRESGFAYRIPLTLGQKTGFYFDQRALRTQVERLARGRRVLDAYSFVGPFSLAAARGGAASVSAVDESALALKVGAECAKENGLDTTITYVEEDARKALQRAAAEGGYGLVIVDPPRLASTRGSRENALTAYARLAELGCRATAFGGDLVLCSCSAAVDLAALTRALATGALRAHRRAVVWERHFQGMDHPVPAAFQEGLYLKALVAKIDER